MEGVAYIFIILCYLCGNVQSSESAPCPAKCPCLGNFLDCSQKGFTTIPNNIPNWVEKLNLRNNNIKILNPNSLKSLGTLKELILNKNKITTISDKAFHNSSRLRRLEINRNRLQSIDPLTFKNLNQLTELSLRRNHIRELKDGAFFGLLRIESLGLDYNEIKTITKSWLYGLDNLQKMSLSNNSISTIELGAWELCKNLIELNLAYNNLTTIKKEMFVFLYLEHLNLDYNNINYIEEGAFSSTPNLKILHLSHNKIHLTIEDANGVFRGLSNLEKFYIASNNIKSIKRNAFLGLNKVFYLDLNDNNVTSLQKNAFYEMPLIQVLIMNTNSLLCDCNLLWFYNWLKVEQKLKPDSRVICAYPEFLRNQSLLHVPTNNFTCDNFVKPRLTEQPDAEIMALKGENISLSCKAMSSSPSSMSFQWKKDGKDISNVNMIVFSNSSNGKNTESTSILKVFGVQLSDSGKYQCIVSNNFGTTYSQKCNISVLIYPQFQKIPKNVTIQSGQNVRLECRASGEPKPEIAWQKDGGNDFPAARERRMQVMTDDDVFFILNVKPVDMGVYSCTAHNLAGTIIANATVIVEEKPYFSKPMEDQEVISGESVVLQCMAGGHPKPVIEWLKNGEPIRATDRHFFTAEDQLMIITDAVLKDAGTYQCYLNNTLGDAKGYSQLIVKPGLAGNEIISDKMGIIIITVVCCAVLTSVVWVVIIYQTRKRMRPHTTSPPVPQDPLAIEFTETATNHFPDNTSDHSSWKDSGTGDSAKRSNDDLLPEDEFTLIINNVNTNSDAPTTMRAASLVYVPVENNPSQTPLLHPAENLTYQRSTNHDRLSDTIPTEVVVIEKFPT